MTIKDKIKEEVVIQNVFHCPDIASGKTLNTVVMLAGKSNEYVWNTLSDKYPEAGETKTLSCSVAEVDYPSHNCDRKAYRVTNCRFS